MHSRIVLLSAVVMFSACGVPDEGDATTRPASGDIGQVQHRTDTAINCPSTDPTCEMYPEEPPPGEPCYDCPAPTPSSSYPAPTFYGGWSGTIVVSVYGVERMRYPVGVYIARDDTTPNAMFVTAPCPNGGGWMRATGSGSVISAQYPSTCPNAFLLSCAGASMRFSSERYDVTTGSLKITGTGSLTDCGFTSPTTFSFSGTRL